MDLSMEPRAKNMQYRITIQGRESTIGIGKDIIRGLGYPKFVKFLVNEAYDELLFVPCEDHDPMSFKVPDDLFDPEAKFRIYSKPFVRDIMERNDLSKTRTHLFHGVKHTKENAIVFQLR